MLGVVDGLGLVDEHDRDVVTHGVATLQARVVERDSSSKYSSGPLSSGHARISRSFGSSATVPPGPVGGVSLPDRSTQAPSASVGIGLGGRRRCRPYCVTGDLGDDDARRVAGARGQAGDHRGDLPLLPRHRPVGSRQFALPPTSASTSAVWVSHCRRVGRFEVQAQQRLGVARAQVEPPVTEIDREPVEPILFARRRRRRRPRSITAAGSSTRRLISPDAA